ncbi:MAG: hypothetical protein IJL67_02610 [Oscillospiraceae bacterium]|nr:hypothetical protein [Oscillospiraceae bacterium]
MDYITKPTNRKELRDFSVVFRCLFGITDPNAPFPVLEALEMIPDVFKGAYFVIVEDKELPVTVPARCLLNGPDDFKIEIKESVYRGAFEKKIGAYLGFICHEMCHIFLYKIGFTPIVERSFGNNEIPAYKSVEWQTKAICGEVLMPYDATANMHYTEIMKKYHVSKDMALYRDEY